MSNDVRNIKNIRERPTKELMKEYKAKEREQKDIAKAHVEALREEKRRTKLGQLQQKRIEQKAKLQEQVSVQKQKAEIKRLKQETGLMGKARKLQQQLKARQLAMKKRIPRDKKPSVKKPKIDGKVYIIKGVAYHYKSGRMIKVPIGRAKPKKKKDEWL